ncbi:MAG TPA: flagellar biosynthetic protein FliR [Kofleriaceae bacterium]|nr:flagellar biosynthetic protein FliR [Kofleriaceae bacterium]
MTVAVLALRGVAAIFVLTTLVGGVPRVAQAALAIGAGLWSALLVAPVPPAHATFISLAFVVQEVALGAALGVAGAIPLLAAQTAGRLVDRGPARTYSTLFGVLAAAVFVGIDGHVAVVTSIVDSHRAFPALAETRPGVLAAIAALVPAAVRLATPWLVTAAVVELAVGAGVRVAGRAGAHVPAAAAVPAALAMMTASLVAMLAIAMAAVMRGSL